MSEVFHVFLWMFWWERANYFAVTSTFVFPVFKMCSTNHDVVTAYVYIFIYSKCNFILQCTFSVVVCAYVLHKHPCLPSCPQLPSRSARRIVIKLSWFTLGCVHLKSSAVRLAMSSWWTETGREMIIFCPSCSI